MGDITGAAILIYVLSYVKKSNPPLAGILLRYWNTKLLGISDRLKEQDGC